MYLSDLTIELVRSKLNVGDILNYKNICELLSQPYYRGNQKNSQLKEFKRYFDFENINRKIFIKEIYEECKSKECRSSYVNYEQFLPSYEDGQKNGVYIIQKNNQIYIGSTTVSFRSRFLGHIEKKNKLITYDMLNNGATFDILWFADDNTPEYIIRDKEEQYIKYYLSLKEYDVVNTRMNTYAMDLNNKDNKLYNENKLNSKYKTLKLNDIEKIKKFCEERIT